MEIERKYEILRGLSECAPENGAGEEEPLEAILQNFLPLRSYSKLADQKVFLITGWRGSGKTELFRVLTSCGGLDHVISERDRSRYTGLRDREFLVGYIAAGERAKFFPAPGTCDEFLEKENPARLDTFWGGLVSSVLLQRFAEETEVGSLAEQYFGKQLREKLSGCSSEVSGWWSALNSNREGLESFLDRIDSWIGKRDIQISIVYDELDRVCGKYSDLFLFIRGLLDFWYQHNSRFTNIKAKIFLRSDLYHSKSLQFVDASKMRAYRLELSWDTLSLYRLLVKRMANAGVEALTDYLMSVPGLLSGERKEGLGYLPGNSEAAYQALIEKMIGKYMGKTPKRGASYMWVPNHIQDANGQVAPRAFLKCFVLAALEMLQQPDELAELEEERILSPTRLQGALREVSADRVQELVNEEYQWMQVLPNRLRGKSMLMEKQEFLEYISPGLWHEADRDRLPGRTAQEILDVLLDVGIVMRTADGRLNVPELYLHGLGLKRKGGIKRPK